MYNFSMMLVLVKLKKSRKLPVSIFFFPTTMSTFFYQGHQWKEFLFTGITIRLRRKVLVQFSCCQSLSTFNERTNSSFLLSGKRHLDETGGFRFSYSGLQRFNVLYEGRNQRTPSTSPSITSWSTSTSNSPMT